MTLKEALKKAGNRKATIKYKGYDGRLPWSVYLQSDEEITRCADVEVVNYREYESECCGWSPFSGVISKYTVPAVSIILDSRQATAILRPNLLKRRNSK